MKQRVSTGLLAILLVGGAMAMAAPEAGATGTLPAPTPPKLLSATASGTVRGVDTITVKYQLSPTNFDLTFGQVYGNGHAVSDRSSSQSGNVVTEVFPMCAGVIPPATRECISQQDVDAMQIGSTITVTEYGRNLKPVLTNSAESVPSNSLRVTVG